MLAILGGLAAVGAAAYACYQYFKSPGSVDDYLETFGSDDLAFRVDDYFLMFEYKVKQCSSQDEHSSGYQLRKCAYAHPGEKARRRDPRKYQYSGTACHNYQVAGECSWGDACEYAHGEFECLFHPACYRTQLCKDGTRCPRRFCLFAHTPEQLRVQPYTRRQTILKLFEQMIEWRRRREETRDEDHPFRFNWTHFHLSILHTYAFKLDLNSDSRVLSFATLLKDEFWYGTPGTSTRDASIVACFVRELQEFFLVPKQHQLFERDDSLKQEEVMETFINFLLRLLRHRKGSINSLEDRIKHLEKVLRFLLTVVGDKSLIYDEEHEQVQNLLAEIEAVTNEAGGFVHSVVFSTSDDRIFETMDERLDLLRKHVDLLKDNIIKSSKLQPVITETNKTPKTASVNSLFIVDSLLYDLEDLVNREDDMIYDVKDQIKELQQKLMSFNKWSQYPEMEELKEHNVMRIRDMAYEAEFLINSYLVGDAPSWYFSIRLSHVINKIKLVETESQETRKKYDDVVASKVAKDFSAKLSLQNKRSSEVNDVVVGFDDKVIDILNHLVGEEEHLQVISVFGMTGLGKTTLAKKLYNHPLVKYNFDKCSWCVVSQIYYRKNLLIDILDSLKCELDKVETLKMEEENLVEYIYKSLKGRRYLIVMDDLWSSDAWYDLQRCFPDDQNKSRILFTSRNKDVAPPNSILYELSSMSDDHCWELLKKKVFQNKPCPPQLRMIGKRIAANCRGIPLAVVVIAGILSNMDKERGAWENVQENLASYIFSDQNNSVMQILELSYKYLPDHLKPCFLYFGAFPEDTQVPTQKLMRLWIAEGFISSEDKERSESLAEEYLMELIDKSLVMVAQRRSDGGVKACAVHDLLRDFCLKRCKEEYFLEFVDKYYSIYEKHHRLCVRSSAVASPLVPLFSLHVRSLFGSLHKSSVLNMKLLRVLDSLNTSDDDNLSEIDLLVHLRYLTIEYVPSSMCSLAVIGSLVNLEFLVVHIIKTHDCDSVFIPSVMVKMKKLRYVKLTKALCFDKDCDSFQTNNLEFLSYVCIMNLKDEEVLRCAPHLRRLKCNCKALWDEEKGEYRYPNFSFFTQLESLSLTKDRWDRKADTISLPLSIKKLTLSGLCLPWENMSIIGGLPNLRVLKLLDQSFEGKVWETRDGEFQQLTFLKLEHLDLHHWNVPISEHFPKLQQLVFRWCIFLHEIPSEIGEIATLQLIDVEHSISVEESAREIEREQRDNGNEKLRVISSSAWSVVPHDHSLEAKQRSSGEEISSDEEISSVGS